jgi:hypothetical protein
MHVINIAVSCHLEARHCRHHHHCAKTVPNAQIPLFLLHLQNLREMGTELDDIEADGGKEIKEAEETD